MTRSKCPADCWKLINPRADGRSALESYVAKKEGEDGSFKVFDGGSDYGRGGGVGELSLRKSSACWGRNTR